MCTETNNLSDLRAGSEIREERIRRLKQELERMKYLEMKSPEQHHTEQVTNLTNKVLFVLANI